MDNEVIEELKKLANEGYVGALVELGKKYYYGIGVEQNYETARKYFETASDKGSNTSNYFLGKIYYNGNGVQVNHWKAKEYFEKSSNTNNVFSTYYLGKLYYWGDGVEKNQDKANEYKNKVLSQPIYTNQNTTIEEFYSIPDFEKLTQDYVCEVQNKFWQEYESLYGNE